MSNLSAYYNRTGDPAKALEYARKAIELDPTSDRAWFQKGRADEREGRLNEAVAALNEAIALNPRSSSYYYVLAGVYRRLGRMDESQKALEHVQAPRARSPPSSRRSVAASRAKPRPAAGAEA